jgi:hypothetical protein
MIAREAAAGVIARVIAPALIHQHRGQQENQQDEERLAHVSLI